MPADRPRRRRVVWWWIAAGIVVVIVLLVALVVAAGREPATPGTSPAPGTSTAPSPLQTGSPPPSPTVTSPPAPAADAAAALAQLAGLEVVDGRSDARYDRELFGNLRADIDRNGCDTRNDVLGRDLLDPVFKAGTHDCKVLAGLLIDPYDGRHVDFVSGWDTSVLVQIDHVVALAWAWRHGAEHWSDEQRNVFANDQTNLVAASDETNQEKSDSGPSEWLPPVPELRCAFVVNFVGVLAAWDLGINAADKAAAEAVLERC